MIPMHYYLGIGAALFVIGLVGVLTRRNLLVIYMSIELMLNAVNINFVTFSHYFNDLRGDVFALFVITVAAAEAAVGLGIVISIFRNAGDVDIENINLLKW